MNLYEQNPAHMSLLAKWRAYPSSPLTKALLTYRSVNVAILACVQAAMARQKRERTNARLAKAAKRETRGK